MYSKEQIETRLRLGASIQPSEVILLIKSMLDRFEEMDNKLNKVIEKQNEISTARRGTNKDS